MKKEGPIVAISHFPKEAINLEFDLKFLALKKFEN